MSLSGPSQVILVEPVEAPVSAEPERVEPPAAVRAAPAVVAASELEPHRA